MPVQTPENKIVISSVVSNLSLVDKLVDTVCEEYNIGEDHYGNILVALSEAVNNAIEHGNKKDPNKFVTVSYKVKDDSLNFMVADEGPGFDPEKLNDPTDPDNIENARGRGIFLIKNLADKVSFSEDGKRLDLEFAL